MLPEAIEQLVEQTGQLGNHFQKYLQIIRRHFPTLNESFNRKAPASASNLVHSTGNYFSDMGIIIRLTENRRQALNFLGCYYAIQFLRFNLNGLNWLEYHLQRGRNRSRLYRNFLLNSGQSFRKLCTAYIHHLFILLDDRSEPLPRYAITGVGTRSDQDDIDVGIIDDGTGSRSKLNQIIGQIGVEMMRFASHFHFHLSEHVGTQTYSASIEEYEKLLRHKIGDVVILTEMLGAALIVGDQALFREFQQKVTSRYYYHGQPNRYYEGYLRGILGEIINLTSQSPDPEYLHPKNDGLRSIKNLIYAYKARLDIREVNPWKILDRIRQTYPHLKKEFRVLGKSLTFLEMFRYLFQLLVVQEEHIAVRDAVLLSNLERLARWLGYPDFGALRGVDQLLQDYREAIQNFRRILPAFLNDLDTHLGRHSVFRKLLFRDNSGNLLNSLFRTLPFFQQVRYWEDFFSAFHQSSRPLKQSLREELNSLSSRSRKALFARLSHWAGANPEFIFEFTRLFNEPLPEGDHHWADQLLHCYLSSHRNNPELLHQILLLYRRKPALIYQTLQFCSQQNLKLLQEIVYQKPLQTAAARHQKCLAELLDLLRSSSHYFRRFIQRVHQDYPCYALCLRQPALLEDACQKMLAQLPFSKAPEERKKTLGQYYDLKFLQLGLETFRGLPVREIDRKFTRFATRYLQELFQICLQETLRNDRGSPRISRNLAIYACGGNGREQAFDDDYDLIIISDNSNPEVQNLYREIIARMNTEMIKRGTLPHFRFGYHFGEYISPWEKTRALLRSDYPECFIDQSQILESRLIVGTPELHRRFVREFIQELIFSRPRTYIRSMIREIYHRHGSVPFFREKCANIKECTGGLRDIEMVILIYKVHYQCLDTNPYRLIEKFLRRDRNLRKYWLQIENALLFLQHFRYLYRLTVAAKDQIFPENLAEVACRLNPEVQATANPAHWLWTQFILHRKAAWDALIQLLKALE